MLFTPSLLKKWWTDIDYIKEINMKNSRRVFIKKAGLTGVAALSMNQLSSSPDQNSDMKQTTTKKGLSILFQGDSITDGNRTRDNDWNHIMGHGYAYLISSRMWYKYPEGNLQFFNRGISGNKITDLEARWQKDALDLQPNIISIMVGINDVNSVVDGKDPQSIQTFKDSYKRILDRTKKDLPNSGIVLCEPFLLPLGRVDNKPKIWQEETLKRQEVVRDLVKTYDTTFVELQKPFIEKCKEAPAEYWIWDGIHPMPAGHELIAQLWMKSTKKLIFG